MAIGAAVKQGQFEDAALVLGDRLKAGSLYRLLAEEGHRLFPDDYFADMFVATPRGRPTVPARTVASVMLLQSFEGLSDREACDRLAFDLRWQAAAGLTTRAESFHPTVLVGMRNRLRASDRPYRLHEDTLIPARQAGALKGRARVLDSTALYDAVATQDTVTQLRAAIRKVLATVAAALAAEIRAALRRDDDYATIGKPPCDWDDAAARDALVDALVRDAHAALAVLDGHVLVGSAADAAALLALVAGQDVAPGEDGVFRIVRGVAKDRTISTVDPEARHGHKSRNRRFDGYKTHVSVDPDSELIAAATATPGNTPDRDAVEDLLAEAGADPEGPKPEVVGDSAYAHGATLDALGEQGYEVVAKVPPARNGTGGFTKDRFGIDLEASTVTCPAAHTVAITFGARGGKASFAPHCAACPLRADCSSSAKGRSITVHLHEAALQRAKAAQQSEEWKIRYRSDRPIVERKIAHFTRRPWGGRKARVRGLERIKTDVATRAGVLNWARLAVLGLHSTETGWAIG
ncbi:MAG TPA: IS1182 family transposase [Acidimicrobiales bacterium]|nr:IS1182 family transposase [Acidimicrobiales bacterium]